MSAPARILLKCRPTPGQLADRLAPPAPEGLELYLDASDLQGPDWLSRTVDRLAAHALPPDFALVVEGPLRSLDGAFFDLTRDGEANRELVRRIAALGRALGAAAANVHAIAPRGSAADFGSEQRERALRAALPLLRYYVGVCQEAGLRPLVENIPPVARMREGAYMYTPIGVAAEDLRWLVEAAPGLGLTVDLSHAQLYVNALRLPPADAPAELAPLLRALALTAAPSPRPAGRECAGPEATAPGLLGYVAVVAEAIVNVHVSNARGLLGEGLPYGEGDADLDPVIARLLEVARYMVTETLEPDQDRCAYMREAQARLLALRHRAGRADGASGPL